MRTSRPSCQPIAISYATIIPYLSSQPHEQRERQTHHPQITWMLTIALILKKHKMYPLAVPQLNKSYLDVLISTMIKLPPFVMQNIPLHREVLLHLIVRYP